MQALEKTLKYVELTMTYQQDSHPIFSLPEGYHFVFYKHGDEKDWVNIHIGSGEFTHFDRGMSYFHQFFSHIEKELPQRCFFIVNDKKQKIATATISRKDDIAILDWVAVHKKYQGKALGKPLISRAIQLAYELGHQTIILHTQTHSWLAAKIYLDLGFSPLSVDENYEGWQILKTIINHPKLSHIESILVKDMYDSLSLLIVEKLNQLHKDNYNYEIWNTDGRNDIYVLDNTGYYEYKYEAIDGVLNLWRIGL